MKKLLIATMLVAIVFIVGCPAPQDMKAQIDKQTETIKNLETKITEQAATIEQLKMDIEKIYTDYYKKAPTTPKSTQPTPPPRVGR